MSLKQYPRLLVGAGRALDPCLDVAYTNTTSVRSATDCCCLYVYGCNDGGAMRASKKAKGRR